MFEAKIKIGNWYILKDLLWGQGLRNYNYICEEGLSEEVVKYLNGFKMIYSNLSSILQSNQVEIIDAINKPFDPNTMDAVMTEENSEVEPNTVLDVLQKGYTYKGKVIRHAMVKVSK